MKWEIVPLEDLTTFIDYRGKTPFKTNSGIPLITAKNIKNRFLDFSTLEYIDPTNYDKWMTRGIPEPNDILFTTEAPVGNVAKLNIDEKVALAQRIVAIRCKKGLLPDYLLYCLTSDLVKRRISKRITGSTVKGIRSKELQKIKIPLPPIEMQKRIAAVLKRADQLPRLREKTIDMLDELLQSIFLDMFGDPVKNPKGWEKKNLDKICLKITDGVHKTPLYVNEGIKFISAKNIKHGFLNFDDIKYISPSEHESFIRRAMPEFGDILLTKSGSIGSAAIIDVDFGFSIFESLALIKYDRNIINGIFLWRLLNSRSLKIFYSKSTRGISIRHLHLSEVKKIPLIIPPLDIQNDFSKIAKLLISIRKKMQKSLAEMDNLFHSLMQKAFKGELNLKEDALDAFIERKKPSANSDDLPVMEEIFDHLLEKKVLTVLGSGLVRTYENKIDSASPEEFIKLHHTVQCDIKDYPKKIEVEHKLLMQLVNIDKYKEKQTGKGLKEWVKEKLDEITQIAMFDKRYVDILLDFEKPEEERETMKFIKDGMSRFADSIGYTTKHIIVELNLKPLLLKRDGFVIQKTGDFSTLNNRVNVKLDIIVTGKIRDLSKIPQYITPEKDIIEEMEKVVYNETEKQVHNVAPEKFYMPFKFPKGEAIDDLLKLRIKERFTNIFFASDVNVIIKRMETDIMHRISNLINGGPYHLDIEVMPLQGGEAHEKVAFEVEFLLEKVSRWETFIYKNFESHSQEIDKIKEVLQKDISANFQMLSSDVSNYTKNSMDLLKIARKSYNKIDIIFGLDIIISYIKLKPIKAEDVRQKVLDEKIQAYIIRFIRYGFPNQPFRFSDIMNGVKDRTTDYENVKNLVFTALRDGLNEKGMHLKQCFFDKSFDSGDEELNKKLRGTIGFQICENKK